MKIDIAIIQRYTNFLKEVDRFSLANKEDQIYLDIKNNRFVIYNESCLVYLSTTIIDKPLDKEGFFFNLRKFLVITSDYSLDESSFMEISFDNNQICILHNKNNYIIEYKDQKSNFELDSSKTLESFDVSLSAIKEAYDFIDKDEFEWNSLSIKDQYIYGITPTKMYKNKSLTMVTNHIKFHHTICRLLAKLPTDSIKVDFQKSRFRIVDIEELDESIKRKPYSIEIYVSMRRCHTMIPSSKDLNEISSIDYHVKIQKSKLLEILNFFKAFYPTDSKPISIKVNSNTEVEFSVISSFDIIKKVVSIENCPSEIIGYSNNFNAEIIGKSLSFYKEDYINFYIHKDLKGMLISTEENKDKTLLIVSYSD